MKQFGFVAAFAVLLALVVACAPATGGPPAASVPGFVKGVITAKGSVWVNGVEYQTAGTSVVVDGVTYTGDANLKVGMTVTMNVVIDPVTGLPTAEAVDYESSVKGLVDTASVTVSSFTVLGQTINVTATTVFDGGSPAITGLTGTTALTTGTFVEVSGTVDPLSGHLVANRVEVQTAGGELAKLVGKASNVDLANSSLTLTTEDNFVVTITASGTLDPAISNGSKVRVEVTTGDTLTVSGSTATLAVPAAQIAVRTEHAHQHDGGEGEVEGLASGVSGTTFTVDGQTVDASKSGLPTVSAGDHVQVHGTMNGSVLVADNIEVRTPESSLSEAKGDISAIDVAARTLTITKADASTVTVNIDASTMFDSPDWHGSNPLQVIADAFSAATVPITVELKYDPTGDKLIKIEAVL